MADNEPFRVSSWGGRITPENASQNRRPTSGLPVGTSIPRNSPLAARWSRVAQMGSQADPSRGTFAGMARIPTASGFTFEASHYAVGQQAYDRGHNYAKEGYNNLNANDQKVLDYIKKNIPYGKQMTYKSLWERGVGLANSAAQQGINITPLQALEDLLLTENGKDGSSSGGGGGGGGGGGAYSQTSVAYSLTDPETAERLVNASLQTYLGRDASAKERSAFYRALNAYEQRNPTITNSAGVSGSGGHTSSTSNTRGGANPTQFAEDWAQSQEGAGEFRASTELLDTFMSALDNPLDIVQ